MSLPKRGVGNLVIRDKRADGYIEKHAWGLDFRMADLDGSRRALGVYQNSARQAPEWALTDVVAIPDLNAVILDAETWFDDMVLADWVQEISECWSEIIPPGWANPWIKYYDARPNQTGSLLWTKTLPKNSSWAMAFLRTWPPAAQTLPVYFAIYLNAEGTIRYCVTIQQDDLYPLVLDKSTDSGATWSTVDRLEREEAKQWAFNAFGRVETVLWRYLKDHLIINLGENNPPWIYYEKDLEIGEGHVRIEVGGGQFAFCLAPIIYAAQGTIERRLKIIPPAFINDVDPDSVDYLGYTPSGTGIAISMQTDAEHRVWPKAILTASGDPDNYWTPALYEIQATRPAIHHAPVTTVIFDNSLQADRKRLLELEFTVASKWRGSTFTALLRDMEGYALSGNEKAAISVALAGGSPTLQMIGYLDSPKLVNDPKRPGEKLLEINGRDRMIRLANKRARLLPSFAGWSLQEAWTWLMHECAGLPETDLLFDDGAADHLFPCPDSDLPLKFDQTADLISIADELAKAASRTWGVDQQGRIFTALKGGAAYGGTPDYVLDEDNADPEDHIYLAEMNRDIFAVRNHVLVLGVDREGNEIMASWRAENSVTDPAFDPFVGDDWWEVMIGPDGCDPWVVAQFTGIELLTDRAFLVWETNGKPDLFPDHYVQVNCSDLGVDPGTVFRITEKWGRLNGESGEFISRFAGVVV